MPSADPATKRKVLRESPAIIVAMPDSPDKSSSMAARVALALSLAAVIASVFVNVPASSSAATAAGPAAGGCRVGEPTTWKTTRFGFPGAPIKSVKFYSPVLVLACGRTGFLDAGSLEIVGYDTSEGLCTSAQVRPQMIFGGGCFASGTSWKELTQAPLKWDGAGWAGGGGGPSQTNLAGYIDTDVATVEVRFRRQGRIWTKAATVAQVEGEVLAKLSASEPFGLFAALLPGCVPPKEINVIARGANGDILGSQRGRFEVRDFCNPAAASKAASH
jgi:hypothetical protein